MKFLFVIIPIVFCTCATAQVNLINTNTNTNLGNLSVIGNNISINGAQNYLVKSYDECNNLQQLPLPVGPGYINDLYRVDSLTVYLLSYLTGPGSLVHKSTDGGNTWVKKLDTANQYLKTIGFFDSQEGLAMGFPYTSIRTKNGGNTWTKDTLPCSQVTAFKIFGDSTIILGADGSYISHDRGNTYSQSGGFFNYVKDFFFLNKDTIFTVSGLNYDYNNNFSRSYDGGLNWLYFNLPIYYPGGVFFKSPTEGYVVGSTDVNGVGMILKTTDMGQHWSVFNTQLGSHLTHIVFLNDSIALVCGTNGVLFKWNTKTTVFTGIKNNNLDNFLVNLFPNPVKDKLSLEFSNVTLTDLQLSIQNTIGQVIYERKVNSLKQEIDLAQYSSGIYFLKVQDGSGQRVFKVIKE